MCLLQFCWRHFGFSKLNSPAHRYLCLRFKRYLAISPARLEARMDSLLSFAVGLFHPLQHAGLARPTIQTERVRSAPWDCSFRPRHARCRTPAGTPTRRGGAKVDRSGAGAWHFCEGPLRCGNGALGNLSCGIYLSSPLSSRARRSLRLRQRSAPSARRRSATCGLRRGSPCR